MEEKVLFLTGFPGFLATRILEKILPDFSRAYLLVEKRFKERAEKEVREKGWRAEVLVGDITLRDLGIGQELAEKLTHAFHLAAIYNLAVKREPAYRVNVLGTENVLNFLAKATRLKSLVYFSTAYVAGWRRGNIPEEDLKNEGFKNWYEWSKFHAEALVRRKMLKIPTIIIRPGIVVGDSKTGEIPKFDGPYYLMNLFSMTGKIPLPYLGRGNPEVNLVPVDFIAEAISRLYDEPKAVGRSFHLTDPAPRGARELYLLFHRLIKGKEPTFTLPLSLVKASLLLPGVGKWLKIPRQILPYMYHPQHFLTENSEELLYSKGIKPPPIEKYAPVLVEFFLKNRKRINFVR